MSIRTKNWDAETLRNKIKNILLPNLFWPFTVWINCSIVLEILANSRPLALNFISFFRSLKYFFLKVNQNNFGYKIPFLKIKTNYLLLHSCQWGQSLALPQDRLLFHRDLHQTQFPNRGAHQKAWRCNQKRKYLCCSFELDTIHCLKNQICIKFLSNSFWFIYVPTI